MVNHKSNSIPRDKSGLPKRICIFDIETVTTSFKYPEKSKVAFAGTMEYVLGNERYHASRYKSFYPDKLNELNDYLNDFPGLIIGHNIFKFDYPVLRKHLNLENVIPKTVDTLAYLFYKNDQSFTGLSLGQISENHFGRRKTLAYWEISQLLRRGRYQRVLKYNKNDCMMTRHLWWHLITRRFLAIDLCRERFRGPWFRYTKVYSRDIPKLLGIKPQYSYEDWKAKIETGLLVALPEKGFIKIKRMPKRFCPFCRCAALSSFDEFVKKFPHSLSNASISEHRKGHWTISYCFLCHAMLIAGDTNSFDSQFPSFIGFLKEGIKIAEQD